MVGFRLPQSVRDAADNSIANADLKYITAARYVKKVLHEIVELFPDDCTPEINTYIVEYIMHQAAKKTGDDTKKFNLISPISDVKDLTYLYTSTHDVSDLTCSEDWESLYGSVVWAKHSKLDPWWPSYICDPRLLYPGIAIDIRDLCLINLGKKHLVYYYGEASKYKYGFASLINIRNYFEYRVEFETQTTETKKKTLQRALPLADSEAIRDAKFRIVWVQYLHEMKIEVDRLQKKGKASSSKKKDNEHLNSESLDSFDEYSAAHRKDSRILTQKKRTSETAVINSNTELTIEIPAKKKANVFKVSDSHEGGAGTSSKQRENDDGDSNSKRKSRLTSNRQAVASVDLAVDSPTEGLSDCEGPTDQATISPIKKRAKIECSDDDADEGAVKFVKDVVELDLAPKKSHKRKVVVNSNESDKAAESARSKVPAKHDAKVSKSRKSLSSASVDDEEEFSGSAGNSHAVALKKKVRPSKAPEPEPVIPDDEGDGEEYEVEDEDDDDDEEVEPAESEDIEVEEEEEYEEEEDNTKSKKKGKPSSKPIGNSKSEVASKSKKKTVPRVVIDLALRVTLDDDSDSSPRSASTRIAKKCSDVSVTVQLSKGKGKAPPAKSHSKAKNATLQVSKPPKEAAKGSKGRPPKSLSSDSSDLGDAGGKAAPLRRSSRAGVQYEVKENEEEDEDEDEEKPETSGEVEVVRERKKGRPRGSSSGVPKPISKHTGKRGRPPGRSASGSLPGQDNRKMKLDRKGSKDNCESDVENDETEEGDREADDDEGDDEEVEEEEEEEQVDEEIIEEVAVLDLKKPLNETPSERLGRLLRILVSNTKESAVKLVDKAIITMDKIENLVLTMDELRESGAAERISLLRKHPNAAIAAKAKQLRAKWMEAARKSVILAAAPTETAPVDAATQPVQALLNDPPASIPQVEAAFPLHSSALSTTGLTQMHSFVSDLEQFDDSIEPAVHQEYKYELLPEEVKSSVARSRCVRMLQTSLGRSIRPSRPICTTTAAIWLEGKVFDALCAAAIQTSNYANTQQASLNSALPVTASKLGSGDTTATTQGAGSAFNRYLANVTRLTFALQMDELRILKEKILCYSSMTQSEVSAFSAYINAAVLAKSTAELEEISASIRAGQYRVTGN